MGIVTASSNGYFVTVTVAKGIVSVTVHCKNCIGCIADVTEAYNIFSGYVAIGYRSNGK